MGRLHAWFAAARHNVLVWVVVAALLVALIAVGIVWATRGSTPKPAPALSTRMVALGDSVPYGHGLANPYLTPQIGLPASALSEGPAPLAYPSLVAGDLRLTMKVRPTNCRLVGDQLAISGAVADPADNTSRDGQCPVPPQQARNLGDEIAAAALPQHPARLVVIQDGADDIHFSSCLENQLARVEGISLGLGTSCIANGQVTPALATELSRVRTSLAHAIEQVAPHAGTVAVLDYYQPVPAATQIASGTAESGLHTNLVCAGLKSNAAGTYASAQLVLAKLNAAIAAAVADAAAHRVMNVRLVDIASAFDGHGMCTTAPWAFSGERVADTTLAADAEHIVAAKTCSEADALPIGLPCASLVAAAQAAESNLQSYVWRAAHPTPAGQRAIAAAVTRRLGSTI